MIKRILLSAAVLSTGSAPAVAAFDQFLIHPALAGWNIGLDGFLGTGDDFVFSGSNTLGAASQFIASNGVIGYFGGEMEVLGIGPFSLYTQRFFGANTHTRIDTFGEWNLASSSIFNVPFTQSLNDYAPSVISIKPDQTYTTSFRLNDGVSGGTLQLTGAGVYLERSQDPASLYSGNQLTHFQTVIPLLPDDWLGVAHEFQAWEVLDGPLAGTTGYTSTTFFITDPTGIPAPFPSTPLGAPWSTTGSALEIDGGIEIGSASASESFGPGTATLAGGAAATAEHVGIGADSLVTVSGADSHLLVGDGSWGPIWAAFGGAQLLVEEGGHVDASYFIGFSPSSGMKVDGAGSQMTLSCAGRECESYPVGVTLDWGSNASVTNGGRISIDGGPDPLDIGIGLVNGSRLTVDGAGSTVDITGDAEAPYLAGMSVFSYGGMEDLSALVVTNGGQVLVNGSSMFTTLAYNPYAMYWGDATGEILVDGTGSLLDAGALFGIGDVPSSEGPGGVGTLIVRNGGTVRADLIYIGDLSTVSGNGGTLEGTVEVHGTLAPGESPGVMTINGDLVLAPDGRLVIELGGTDFDVLNVTGTAKLAGTLEIRLLEGYIAEVGETFDFLNAALFEGAFDAFVLPTFGGSTFAINRGAQGFQATVSPVPLPAALPLFAAALVGLAGWQRRSCNIRG